MIETRLINLLKETGLVEQDNIYPFQTPSSCDQDNFSFMKIGERPAPWVSGEGQIVTTSFKLVRQSKQWVKLCKDNYLHEYCTKYKDDEVFSTQLIYVSDYKDPSSKWYEREYRLEMKHVRRFSNIT